MAKHNEAPAFLIQDLRKRNSTFPKKKFTKALKMFGAVSYISNGKIVEFKESPVKAKKKK